MKLIILECTEEELKAKKGILDSISEALRGLLDGFYGSYSPKVEKSDNAEKDSEAE